MNPLFQFRKRSFFSSLFSRLMVSFILLMIIPVTALGILSFESSKKIISNQISEANINTLTQVEKNVDVILNQLITVLNIYNLNTDIEILLKKHNNDATVNLIDIGNVESKMMSLSAPFDWLKVHTLLLGVNNNIYTTNSEYSNINMEGLSELDWYGEMVTNSDYIYWLGTHKAFFKGGEQTNVFSAIKPLKGTHSSPFYGILIISIEESNIFNIYKDALNGINAIMIIDSKGKIISHSFRNLVGTNIDEDMFQRLTKDDEKGSQNVSMGGKNYLSLSRKVEKTGWYIIELIPMSSVSKEIGELKLEVLIIYLLSIAVASFAATYFLKRITLPLINLTKRIQGISLKTKPDLLEKRHSEIEVLTLEYDHIIQKLDNTITELLKEKERKRAYELQFLQMQINPHFLYNTLNSIKCLVWTGKVGLIEPTIKALVHLLERTINKRGDLVTLEEEIENTRNYMLIQEIRTGNSVVSSIKTDESISKCLVPKLILQPIVENAIFHGIEPKNRGKVSIYCVTAGQNIKIDIIDNGVGMDKNKINEILGKDSEDYSNKHHFSGIGIKNVDERIKLYYGNDYGLYIESDPGIGTSVSVILPKNFNLGEESHG